MRLSVVIPSFRRPELLRRVLGRLAEQTLPASEYEVLVVDDGSEEPPRSIVEDLASRMNVRLYEKPNSGLASTRNYGAARARGELLVFVDDDILACPGFLAAHARVHEQHRRAVALGSLPHPPELEMTPFLYYLERVVHYDLFRRYGSVERIPLPPLNGNSSLRRSLFEEVGGYDTTFARYGGEDTEMGYRLLRSGARFVYAADAAGAHFHLKGFDAYRRDQYSSGMAIVAIARKYPEVVNRVSLDVVARGLRELPWRKRAERAGFLLLHAVRPLRALLALTLGGLEGLGARRAAYPLYLVLGHYEWAAGMQAELKRAPIG